MVQFPRRKNDSFTPPTKRILNVPSSCQIDSVPYNTRLPINTLLPLALHIFSRYLQPKEAVALFISGDKQTCGLDCIAKLLLYDQ